LKKKVAFSGDVVAGPSNLSDLAAGLPNHDLEEGEVLEDDMNSEVSFCDRELGLTVTDAMQRNLSEEDGDSDGRTTYGGSPRVPSDDEED
jgi:hypothetical protein